MTATAARSGLRREVRIDTDRLCRWLLPVMVVVAFASYTLMGLLRIHQLRAGGFDLGIFTQVVNNLAHLRAPAAPIDLKAHTDFFGDHFEPVLVLLVPLWWIHPGPETLIVAQAALIAVSVPFVYAFTRRRLGAGLGLAVAFAFTTYWGVQALAGFDFHEAAFELPLLAIAVERADAGKFKTSAVATLSLLLVKEDLGPLVAELGLFYVFYWRQRRLGALVAAAGVGGFALLTKLVIPAFNPNGSYVYWRRNFGQLAPSPGRIPLEMLRHPLKFIKLLGDNPIKRDLLLNTGLAWLGLPLLSPFFLLAVPLLVERLWSSLPAYWERDYHYDGPIAVILAVATVDTLARAKRLLDARAARRGTTSRASRVVVAAAGVLLVVFAAFGSPQSSPLRALYSPPTTALQPGVAGCWDIIHTVPAGKVVEAWSYLTPTLAARDEVYLPGEAKLAGRHPQYLLTQRNPWSVGVDTGVASGDVKAYERNAAAHGYVVARKAGDCTLWFDQSDS